jgi:hypothetical protein
MPQIPLEQIERFMSGQVSCWNNHDKDGLLALYLEMAPSLLDIQYVGREQQTDGWLVIEDMYDKHNHQFRLEVVTTIINGNEAAAHHRNCIVGTNLVIESIETYRFGPGTLHVRYFLLPPKDTGMNLEQFRGFTSSPPPETL